MSRYKKLPVLGRALDIWPNFIWDHKRIASILGTTRNRQGRLIGRMEALGFSLRSEAVLRTLTLDVLKSSEIEGEILDPKQVRSSIARRLGMDIGGVVPSDRNVDGVVEMMLDATQNFKKFLSKERLFDWHASMFPAGRSGMQKILVGTWRDDSHGPMRVVSGPLEHERVHFEAPAADTINSEMNVFLSWFNASSKIDPVLKAGIAHLWFVTLHHFEDGNGRIGRALADMILATTFYLFLLKQKKRVKNTIVCFLLYKATIITFGLILIIANSLLNQKLERLWMESITVQ